MPGIIGVGARKFPQGSFLLIEMVVGGFGRFFLTMKTISRPRSLLKNNLPSVFSICRAAGCRIQARDDEERSKKEDGENPPTKRQRHVYASTGLYTD